jgi:hypothetical protein
MTAETLALCVVLGFVLGVFPVLVCPTLLCALAALALRLNLPAIQAVNYLVYPLQLALVIPFVRLGDLLFQRTKIQGLLGVLTTVIHAAGAWLCVCAPLGLILYLILVEVLRRWTWRGPPACRIETPLDACL